MDIRTKICLIIINICLYVFISDGYFVTKPRVYTRIPKYFVYEKMENFLKYNGIYDCFYYEESENNLLLKCSRNNKLVDVDIFIKDSESKKIISGYI